MATAYKNKIYTGQNITWNQLVDKSKFQNISSLSGISVINNNDGSVMFDGTKTKSDVVFFSCGTYQITANHKYYLYGAPEGSGNRIYQLYSVFTPTGGSTVYNFDNGSGVFFSGQATASGNGNINIIISQNTVSKIVFTPQLFDLTLMFGAANEPTTPAEFWSYFGHRLYPYNIGETQPLFLIGRKNKIYTGKNITWNQIADFDTLYGDGQYSDFAAYFKTTDKVIKGHKYFFYAENIPGSCSLGVWRRNENNKTRWITYPENPIAESPEDMVGGVSQLTGHFWIYGFRIHSSSNILLCDLTLMFGAGNEPSTPEEFWSHFGRKYYDYNTGETQPLFTIGRKSQTQEG